MSIQVLDIVDGNAFDVEHEKAIGVDAVIVKAGQGQLEYKWRSYIEQVKRAGLTWGLYWVVDARYSPESQKAALKASFPDGDFGPLGLWLDVEKPIIWMPEAIYKKLPYAFYKTIESIAQGMLGHSKTGVGIYTSPGQWQLCSGNVPKDKLEWFALLPLWTAQYKTIKPDLYGAWKSAVLWQYQGEPDYSIVQDEAWWAKKAGVPPTQVVTTPPAVVVVSSSSRPRIELHVTGDVEIQIVRET